MSRADTAEYQLEQLMRVLNKLRGDNEKAAGMDPGNDLARVTKAQAQGYLKALDQVAEQMGLTVMKVYTL